MASSLEELFNIKDSRYIIFSNEKRREELKSEVAAFIGAVSFVKPEVIIYLDKSARPISWLTNDVLKQRFQDIKRPETKFLNIGREKVIPSSDLSQQEAWNRWQPEEIEKIRAVFTAGDNRTHLDGKKIWLVDEYSVTGTSLLCAKNALTEAFGNTISHPIETKTVLSHEPSWYEYKYMLGVEDIDEYNFLSKRSPGPDSSHQLRGELSMIADEIAGDY